MFQVFTGPSEAARNYLAYHKPPTPKTFWLEGDARFQVTHRLMRRLLPHLRMRFGNEVVEKALARHAPALSMVFGKLVDHLSPLQIQQKTGLCGKLDSNITHNLTVALPLVNHCCELIDELLNGETLELVIPDVGNLDWCSQQVLKVLYKDFPHCNICCYLGFSGRDTLMEDSGIVFRYSTPVVKSFIYSFRTVPNFSVHDLDEQPDSGMVVPRLLDPYDDDHEQQALELAFEGRAADPPNTVLLMRVMESCFESYGYTSALYLGTKLLEAAVLTDARHLARTHGIVALTAHNRQFFAEGNQQLAIFLQKHYEAALANETEPGHRICLHYRLAVTHARRKRELNPAKRYIQEGLSELQQSSVEEPQRSCLDAWLRNIHSFVLMHVPNFPLAVEEHEVAFAKLSQIEPEGVWANEVAFSSAVLSENLGLLFNLIGDAESSRKWYAIEEQLSKKWPVLDAVPSAEWQNYYARNFMLKEAVAQAARGVSKAAATLHFNLEYFFILTLADLYYRMGETESSLRYFEQAIELQAMSESVYGTPFLLRTGAAATALKGGDTDRARSHLDWLSGEDLSLASRCRLRCLEASVFAALGDRHRTETAINEAIEAAAEHEEKNLLVQVATRAGELCLVLGQPKAAAQAFAQGRALCGDPDEEPTGLLPATIFALLIGMLNSGQGDDTMLQRAVGLAPKALTRSREPWWLLADLLRHLNASQSRNQFDWESLQSAVTKIQVAAGQRDDCRDGLRLWNQTPPLVANASANT